MDKLGYLIPVFAANTIYGIYNKKNNKSKYDDEKYLNGINTENVDEITIKYNKHKKCNKLKKGEKTYGNKFSLFNFNVNNKDRRTYLRDYYREDGKTDTTINRLPKQKNNIDYKMNQIFYIVKNIYKIHNVLSSVIRIKSRTGESNGTIKKNLTELSSLLLSIKKSTPNNYHFEEHLQKYGNIIYKLTKKLIDNNYDILEYVAEADEIVAEWYHLHDVYYINSKNI